MVLLEALEEGLYKHDEGPLPLSGESHVAGGAQRLEVYEIKGLQPLAGHSVAG